MTCHMFSIGFKFGETVGHLFHDGHVIVTQSLVFTAVWNLTSSCCRTYSRLYVTIFECNCPSSKISQCFIADRFPFRETSGIKPNLLIPQCYSRWKILHHFLTMFKLCSPFSSTPVKLKTAFICKNHIVLIIILMCGCTRPLIYVFGFRSSVAPSGARI